MFTSFHSGRSPLEDVELTAMTQPSSCPSTHLTLFVLRQYRSSSQFDEKDDVRDVMGDEARVRHGSSVEMVLVCDMGIGTLVVLAVIMALSSGLLAYRRTGDRHDRRRFVVLGGECDGVGGRCSRVGRTGEGSGKGEGSYIIDRAILVMRREQTGGAPRC